MNRLDPNLTAAPTSQTAKLLHEEAAALWRLAAGAPDPNPYRMRAMALHARALAIEAQFNAAHAGDATA